MKRPRRALSPRMRELTALYGVGAYWPIHLMTRWMRLADPEFRDVFIAGLTRQPPSALPSAPPTA